MKICGDASETILKPWKYDSPKLWRVSLWLHRRQHYSFIQLWNWWLWIRVQWLQYFRRTDTFLWSRSIIWIWTSNSAVHPRPDWPLFLCATFNRFRHNWLRNRLLDPSKRFHRFIFYKSWVGQNHSIVSWLLSQAGRNKCIQHSLTRKHVHLLQ